MALNSDKTILISFTYKDNEYQAKISPSDKTESEVFYHVEIGNTGETYLIYLDENAQWRDKELGNSDFITAIGNQIENTFA